MKLWIDQEWRPALNEAIYWYINSNYSARGIDAGLILTHTALERLSFTYAVETAALLSNKEFRKTPSSCRLRLLFASLGIPLTIPPSMTELADLAKQHNWTDAPQGLTEIRNEQVHPQHKKRGQFEKALHNAWNLALWYVEMVVLRLCNYSGEYSNRLISPKSIGQVEKVPWSV